MSIKDKRNALIHVYRVLDKAQKNKTPFCHRGCHTCCTLNVTMTTLEGLHLLDHLKETNQLDRLKRLIALKGHPCGAPPGMTINALAKRSAETGEMDEEPPRQNKGVCPLLSENECTVYPARPLACRIMISNNDCRITGVADMDPFVLTINNVMLQFTEHIDQEGLTGHMMDVMAYLSVEANRRAYELSSAPVNNSGLLSNQPLTILMVPPEHRRSLMPVLKALNPAMGDIY